MILLLLVTADRTLRKGIKAFKKESNLKVPASRRQDVALLVTPVLFVSRTL